MRGLLNAVWSWSEFFQTYAGTANEAVKKACDWITAGVWIVFGIVGLAGVVYSIYLGVQLARADDQSKRDDVKKHFVTVIIALAVTLVLVLFFLHILPAIISAFSNLKPNQTSSNNNGNGFIHF